MIDEHEQNQRRIGARWRDLLATPDQVAILDTETTGLSRTAEIVEIAIIDGTERTLVDTLIKPTCTIPADAARIHGITESMVANAPSWPDVQDEVLDALRDQQVVIYNRSFDARLMQQSAAAHGMYRPERPPLIDFFQEPELYVGVNHKTFPAATGPIWLDPIDQALAGSMCAMLAYAEWWGDWNDYHQNWRWQKLSNAAGRFGIDSGGAHRALADCRMTLGVMQGMAGLLPEVEPDNLGDLYGDGIPF